MLLLSPGFIQWDDEEINLDVSGGFARRLKYRSSKLKRDEEQEVQRQCASRGARSKSRSTLFTETNTVKTVVVWVGGRIELPRRHFQSFIDTQKVCDENTNPSSSRNSGRENIVVLLEPCGFVFECISLKTDSYNQLRDQAILD